MIPAVRRTLLAMGWLLVIVVLALGGAGIVAQWSHPPGTSARAELTWQGDRDVAPSLDAAQVNLQAIAGQVDRLAVLARGALAAMTADDQGPFTAALTEGGDTARSIQSASAALRVDLLALPGGRAADSIGYGGNLLGRRAAMLTALESTEGLASSWARLTAGSVKVSDLIARLTDHDLTVAAAAAEGRAADYEAALATLARAAGMLDDATAIRDQLANATDVSTLDAWLSRNRRYDAALVTLYSALRDSGGIVNDTVREAYREESAARAVLPPDTRGLVLIVADIGRGGLNQAVIAIEQARGRLNLALQALVPVEGAAP
ncbi:MAG: hypothetical protein C0498_08935 [Anaerolinea sp.]|nr:hypothetical protein [Anaerolinea sp.]